MKLISKNIHFKNFNSTKSNYLKKKITLALDSLLNKRNEILKSLSNDYQDKFSKKTLDKYKINTKREYINHLSKDSNELQLIVEKKYPIIKELLTNIKNEKGCHFSRMTGSGSVCYGLFNNQILAKKALNKLKYKYPKFWFSLAKTV